jgi:hypothetical protein
MSDKSDRFHEWYFFKEITVDGVTARLRRTDDDEIWSFSITKAPLYPMVAWGTGTTPTRDYLVHKLKEYNCKMV